MKTTSQKGAELLAVEPKVAALSLPGMEAGGGGGSLSFYFKQEDPPFPHKMKTKCLGACMKKGGLKHFVNRIEILFLTHSTLLINGFLLCTPSNEANSLLVS